MEKRKLTMIEINKSNYQMIKDFTGFTPDEFGVLNEKEYKQIKDHFMIAERSDIELQNLRNFVVLYYNTKEHHDIETADIMSAICGVIDIEKTKRGLSV